MILYGIVVSVIGLIALAFIFRAPAIAVTLTALACFSLAPIFQGAAGVPANVDGRLHAESWRLLSVAPLADGVFVIAVLYPSSDVRTYRLSLANQADRDAFLKAAQGLKRGRAILGKARHGRAGLTDDGAMQFEFGDAPETEPKGKDTSP